MNGHRFALQLLSVYCLLCLVPYVYGSPARLSPKKLMPVAPNSESITTLDKPTFIPITQSQFADNTKVIGIYWHGVARAYPYPIMDRHQIVNDTIAGTPIAVTLSPLCDTTPVFVRQIAGQTTTFRVSGNLYQSCLVMRDQLSDSYWIQPWGIAVIGQYTNQVLQRIPAIVTTVAQWRRQYPKSQILAIPDHTRYNYHESPYGNYRNDTTLPMLSTKKTLKLSIPAKTIVYYIWRADKKTPSNHFSGISFAIAKNKIKQVKQREIDLDGWKVMVVWDKNLSSARFYDMNKKEIPASTAYAFSYIVLFSRAQ